LRPFALIGLIALVGLGGAQVVPLLGPAALALLGGVAIRTLAPVSWTAGVPPKLGSRALQISIVALGVGVNLSLVATVAADSFAIMIVTLAIGLGAILLIGRWFRLEEPMAALIAAGTAICGASAIAAVAPVVNASGRQTGRAVAVIFAFNLTAIALFPLIGHAIDLPSPRYAVWAGTAVNDTSSVLAAAFAFGPATVASAATVKLARTLMIIPVVLLFTLTSARAVNAGEGGWRAAAAARLRLVPLFVIAFLAGATANTAGLVPSAVTSASPQIALLGTVVALAAIGLTVDLRSFAGSGSRAVVLGLAGWLIVASSSLVLIELIGADRAP
jgi:uncharacterized integral membrane protein (TIGR00698 family)